MQFVTPDYKINYKPYDAILDDNHILIAGCQGSGKSVLLNNLIEYLITNTTPNKTRFFLLDPKKVELHFYEKLPFTMQYADTHETMLNALNNAIDIMMQRYDDMKSRDLRKYDGYNIYIVIDELADLFSLDKKAFSERVNRLARLGRAARVFLITCTQKPSRQILPPELCANFSACVALRCTSAIESRQIINIAGAEKLPRFGECIIKDNNSICYSAKIPPLDENSLNKIIKFWCDQFPPDFNKIQANKNGTNQNVINKAVIVTYGIIFLAMAIISTIPVILFFYFLNYCLK